MVNLKIKKQPVKQPVKKSKSKLEAYRKKMKVHLLRLDEKLQCYGYIFDLMSTYALTKDNKMSLIQKHVYEYALLDKPKIAITEMINKDIYSQFATNPAKSADEKYNQYLTVMSKRFVDVKIGNIKCINRLLKRTKIPRGINKLNFPAYVVMFYYVTLIDIHAHDREGLLVLIKHFANCACSIYLEKPMEVLGGIMVAINYNVSCDKPRKIKRSTLSDQDKLNNFKLKIKSEMDRANRKLT
jgi:hypothetical protein